MNDDFSYHTFSIWISEVRVSRETEIHDTNQKNVGWFCKYMIYMYMYLKGHGYCHKSGNDNPWVNE